MFFIYVPAVIWLALLVVGIYFTATRRKAPWRLWIGTGLIVLFILLLIVAWPFFLLSILLITGGSFS